MVRKVHLKDFVFVNFEITLFISTKQGVKFVVTSQTDGNLILFCKPQQNQNVDKIRQVANSYQQCSTSFSKFTDFLHRFFKECQILKDWPHIGLSEVNSIVLQTDQPINCVISMNQVRYAFIQRSRLCMYLSNNDGELALV